MNFFEAQDDARRKTWQLALLFGAAIICLIVLTNVLVAVAYLWTSNTTSNRPVNLVQLLQSIPLETWFLISLGVLGLVGVASLYKFLLVRGGGRTIAESLGGHLLTYDTSSGSSRRLLNVVEEMAIAAGTAVPPVYLIPESSINAFAAGFGPDDAVIGVNQGTIDLLSRDELQGVIAHEFSHILNGDVSINLRLIAILHGILFIGMIGYGILRGVGYGMGRGSRRSNGNSGAAILALGVGLLIIGYAGTFFGNLIKAAVSRQREYLADASAVQFTRNPEGIGGALKKIGGWSEGSSIKQPAAAEASHMFFGQVRTLFMNGLTSTHPPLDKRIRAIDPNWDGEFPVVAVSPADQARQKRQPDEAVAGFAGIELEDVRVDADPGRVTDKVGTLDSQGLDAARAIIASTAEDLREAAHDGWGCRGLIYAILLDEEPGLRDRQFAHLQQQAEPGVPEYTAKLLQSLAHLDAPQRLTLVSSAVPALKALSRQQYDRFIGNVIALIKMDRSISLPEWVLHRILVKELKPHFEGPQRVRPRHKQVDAVADEAAILLSTIARFGHEREDQRQLAFNAGVEALDLRASTTVEFQNQEDVNFAGLNQAIAALRLLKPLAKPRLIKACAATATADGQVSGLEGALLQGFAAALDCPLPPSIYSARVVGG